MSGCGVCLHVDSGACAVCYGRSRDEVARLESELREARVDVAEVQAAREWISQKTGVGGGTRPLSFITASHEQIARERAAAESALSAESTARRVMREALERAPHGFMCRSSRWQRESDAARAAGWKEWSSTLIVPEKPDEEHCNCWKRAALAAEPGEGPATPGGCPFVSGLDAARATADTCHHEWTRTDGACVECIAAALESLDRSHAIRTPPPEGHPRAAEGVGVKPPDCGCSPLYAGLCPHRAAEVKNEG